MKNLFIAVLILTAISCTNRTVPYASQYADLSAPVKVVIWNDRYDIAEDLEFLDNGCLGYKTRDNSKVILRVVCGNYSIARFENIEHAHKSMRNL